MIGFKLNEKIYCRNYDNEKWILCCYICSFEGKNYFCINNKIEDLAMIKSFNKIKIPEYRPFNILDNYILKLKDKYICDRNDFNRQYKILGFDVIDDTPLIRIVDKYLTLDELFKDYIFDNFEVIGVETTFES